jgi:hypothetical protein
LLEPKVQKLIFVDLDALELAVALGHLTVALSGHINQVFFTTNKATHLILLPNRSPYLADGLTTIA